MRAERGKAGRQVVRRRRRMTRRWANMGECVFPVSLLLLLLFFYFSSPPFLFFSSFSSPPRLFSHLVFCRALAPFSVLFREIEDLHVLILYPSPACFRLPPRTCIFIIRYQTRTKRASCLFPTHFLSSPASLVSRPHLPKRQGRL